MAIQLITVIGTGTMGRGIAHVAAAGGYDVIVNDVEQSLLDSAMASIRANLDKAVSRGNLGRADADAALGRIVSTTDIEEAARQANLIIEAVPENLELKKELFSQADLFCAPDTIIATNTSSLSIRQLAGAVERRDRFVGMHFFNPVHVMKLLEIVVGERTSQATVEEVLGVAARMQKEAIVVRDSPGFATSRLGIALGLEAIRMLEQGVASAADIDKAMELGYNHPMGPLRLTDLVGLDVRLSIAEYLSVTLGPRFEPPQLLRTMVEAGKLGKKSGQGFYEWSE